MPKPAPTRRIYELRATINDTKPVIWRNFRIPSDASLLDLHHVIQVVIGWTNSHLHEFRHGRQRYGTPDPDGFLDDGQLDGADHTIGSLLTKPKQTLDYTYDFGDDWNITITLLAVHADGPELVCSGGERAGPPEDCGGPMGYANMLDTLAKPKGKAYAETLAWFREMTPPDHDVAVCPLDCINEDLANGLDGVREIFGDEGPIEDEADDDGDDDGKIIQFPTGGRR